MDHADSAVTTYIASNGSPQLAFSWPESWSSDDDDYRGEEVVLPDEKGHRVTRNLRFSILSSYRKCFALIFTANMAVLLGLAVRAHGTPHLQNVGDAAAANLTVCILFRQEEFVNLLYVVFSSAPHSLPLWMRKRLAKVYHYGGCHSGCGIAAAFWFVFYTALVTKSYVDDCQTDILAVMICSWLLVCMLFFITIAAYPKIRIKSHNSFEAIHRFAGWTALVIFWINIGLASRVLARQQSSAVGLVLVESPTFWFIIISTSCILISWSRLRLREVEAEVLSSHAMRLHFQHKNMKPFSGVKLSRRPLTEWHAFAAIPDPDRSGFSIVVSAAGDWTKHYINNPPEKFWIRGYPLYNVQYTSRLFKRIVVVASGSGMGPCLSLFAANLTPCRVLWSTRDPHVTYGASVINAVLRADPNAVIWDTTRKGYPNMVEETWRLVEASNAEAVYITSNPKLTERVIYGMRTRGIPAFGPIFDS